MTNQVMKRSGDLTEMLRESDTKMKKGTEE